MKKLFYVALVATLFTTTTTIKAADIKSQKEIAALRAQIKELTAGNAKISRYLQTFDTLDFTFFSNQQWVRLHESHAKDIKVNWPDGHLQLELNVILLT